jgi:endonuclease YncB( thermonuclease family)
MDENEFQPPPAQLDALLSRTRELGFQGWSWPQVGALLRTLAATKPGGKLLEIGTGTGVGTLWLLDGMDQHAHLTSVETDPPRHAIARTFLDTDPRITLPLEDARRHARRGQGRSGGGIMQMASIRLFARLILILLTPYPALAAEITGIPRVVDGDTVEIGQVKIRLSGIDAPETDQLCLDAKSEKWACGIAARDQLIRHSNGQTWECSTTGTDHYGRSLANCFVEGEDVSAWMVRSGWALSFVRYSHAYDADEVVAREAHAGLWSGAFIAPWDWRHRNKTTIVLGAASVPINAQTILLGAVSASEGPSRECVIKGNVNRKGERIYHLPGQLNYAQINMTKGLGEQWFCSEAEANAAGWRKAVR